MLLIFSPYFPALPGVSGASLQINISGEIDSFMGELNFCLGPSDSVLSGPSLLKDLNTATNKMVKNLLILNSPGAVLHQAGSW